MAMREGDKRSDDSMPLRRRKIFISANQSREILFGRRLRAVYGVFLEPRTYLLGAQY
jgi:hypothetical protein